MLGQKTSLLDRCAWRLGILDRTSPLRIERSVLATVVLYHLLALLAFVPWLFSWTGMLWALCGLYLFGTLGINVGFHRLLTHRSFACPRWLEHGLSVLGCCCYQGTPLNWVAVHRMHHQHSDDADDPHSPRATFFWAHMGWFLVRDPKIYDLKTYDRFARDLIRDRFYKRLERPDRWRRLQWTQWAVFLLGGMLVGGLATWTWLGAVQLGLSWLVWGVFIRTVAVWHITWSVNSVTHVWGYRNFDTRDDSRNNVLVGLVSNGEGWHNNHHAQPRSASHGMRWWELDISYITIWMLEHVGLAWDVIKPRPAAALAPSHAPSPPRSTEHVSQIEPDTIGVDVGEAVAPGCET